MTDNLRFVLDLDAASRVELLDVLQEALEEQNAKKEFGDPDEARQGAVKGMILALLMDGLNKPLGGDFAIREDSWIDETP